MSEDVKQKATLCIDTKLLELPPMPLDQPCIFRVDDRLRKVNKESYQPKTIAIGPYHHHKHYPPASTIRLMEEHKLRYLQNLLEKRGERSVERYIIAMQGLEEKARNYYAEPINDLDSEEFVKMMVLDGCFIVEFLRKLALGEWAQKNDPLFQRSHIFVGLMRDLLLFENQLPLFILVHILDIVKTSFPIPDNIIFLSLQLKTAFGEDMTMASLEIFQEDLGDLSVDGVEHLLGLTHYYWCHPFGKKLKSEENVAGHQVNYIKSATELQEAGVKFKTGSGTTLFDINFEKGEMKIPRLVVQDRTEYNLRNLIAYEQYRLDKYPRYFTDYAILMDCLVNSSEDVQILRHQGILMNGLGDDNVVSTIFNKLCLEVCRSQKFHYSGLFHKLDRHCQKQSNLWMASLRRNYFYNPWAIISFFAALILLILTVAQTVFSVLSFFR